MESTTLVTFLLKTPGTVVTVDLLGSWDNFSKPYRMDRDRVLGLGHWRGCHSFTDIVSDGETIRGPEEKRAGGLMMGGKYWYYYRLDNVIEYFDRQELVTTFCPFLPGQEVNILEVPTQRKQYKGPFTLNPDDKFTTPVPPATAAVPELERASSVDSSESEDIGRFQRPVTPRRASEIQESHPWTQDNGSSSWRKEIYKTFSPSKDADQSSSKSRASSRRSIWKAFGAIRNLRSAHSRSGKKAPPPVPSPTIRLADLMRQEQETINAEEESISPSYYFRESRSNTWEEPNYVVHGAETPSGREGSFHSARDFNELPSVVPPPKPTLSHNTEECLPRLEKLDLSNTQHEPRSPGNEIGLSFNKRSGGDIPQDMPTNDEIYSHYLHEDLDENAEQSRMAQLNTDDDPYNGLDSIKISRSNRTSGMSSGMFSSVSHTYPASSGLRTPFRGSQPLTPTVTEYNGFVFDFTDRDGTNRSVQDPAEDVSDDNSQFFEATSFYGYSLPPTQDSIAPEFQFPKSSDRGTPGLSSLYKPEGTTYLGGGEWNIEDRDRPTSFLALMDDMGYLGTAIH